MADQKITALTAKTLPLSTDIVPMVEDPGGTPVTKKVTVLDLAGYHAVCSGDAITSTTLVNIAGMSIPLTAGTWVFEMIVSCASSSTAGGKLGVQYSGTTTSVDAVHLGQLATTTLAATARITALNTGSTTVGTTAAAELMCRIVGQIVVTTSGNLTCQALKVTSGTFTINASSQMWARRVA